MSSTENNNRAASHDFQTALGLLEERLRSLEDSESIINGLLQGAAEFYGAARASVVEADWDLKIGLLTYEWCAEGVEHQKDMLQYLAVEGFPRWCDFLSLNKPVVIPDMEAIKDTYPDEYQWSKAILLEKLASAAHLEKPLDAEADTCYTNKEAEDGPQHPVVVAFRRCWFVSPFHEIAALLQDLPIHFLRRTSRRMLHARC